MKYIAQGTSKYKTHFIDGYGSEKHVDIIEPTEEPNAWKVEAGTIKELFEKIENIAEPEDLVLITTADGPGREYRLVDGDFKQFEDEKERKALKQHSSIGV